MTQQTAKPSFINNSSRCTHRFANGMRCRLLTLDPYSTFCANHATRVENQREPADTAASLTADLKEFRSAIPINDFLARLLFSSLKTKSSPPRRGSRLHHQSTPPYPPRHRPRTQSQRRSQSAS